MESIQSEYSSLEQRNDHQMITLVDASNLDDSEMADNSAPLVHHVLEPRMMPYPKTENGQSTQCLLCNAKLGVSGRGAMHIFSNEAKTNTRNLDLVVVLNGIIKGEIKSANTHSTILCKKCFKLIDDIDSVEGQLEIMKQEVSDKFYRTKALVQYEKNGVMPIYSKKFVCEEKIDKDDKEFKIMSKVRSKRGKRSRGRGRPPQFLKLEVKEESEDVLTCLEFSDSNQSNPGEFKGFEEHMDVDNVRNILVSEETGEEVQIEVEDVVEVDGLDLNNEDNTIQIGGMLVPTVNSEMIKKESLTEEDDMLAENRSGKYRCRFCQTRMHAFSQIQDHLIQYHPDRLFECEVCEERAHSQSELLEHMGHHLVSGEKPYSCRLCSREYSFPRQLREHLRHHLNKTIPCYKCPKRFRTETALQEHISSHTGRRPYSCDQCHKRFSSIHVLKNHAKTHGARKRPHKCKVCGKHFLLAHHLSDHMQTHQNSKEFVCETCGKAFSTQRSLDLHSVTHSGIKNYVCNICFKAFARKGEVEDHERIHTGEKPFQCEICGATFRQRSNLQSHKKATHYEEKKYLCEQCNKAFKRRRLLVYHVMSVHTGERPFKCEFCTAAFVYPEHYKKHLRIHTGEKPFKCEICGKAFNSRDNKNAHKFIHSEKKQYECVLCGAGFMRKPHLVAHIAQHERPGSPESYIKVNSSNIVDEELSEARAMRGTMIIKEADEQSIDHNNLEESLHLVRSADDSEAVVIPRQIQIMDADDVQKYIIHKTGDKSDDSVGNFFASLQGHVVEVRTEDLERYTELSSDQLTQMAQAAAQVVATQSNGSTQQDSGDYRLLQIPQSGSILCTESNTTSNSKIDSKQYQGTSFKKSSLQQEILSPQVGAGRQVRSWLGTQNDDYVDHS